MGDATGNGSTDATELTELIDRALAEREARDGFNKKNKITIVAWDGHLDRIWPTLILSTTAAASGMEVSVFFTFWGLFALVKPEKRMTGKEWMTKALSVLNPGAMKRAKLSRYNFAGMGPWMLGKVAEDSIVCRTDFTTRGTRIHGHLLLLPERRSISEMLLALGIDPAT